MNTEYTPPTTNTNTNTTSANATTTTTYNHPQHILQYDSSTYTTAVLIVSDIRYAKGVPFFFLRRLTC